MSISPHQQAKTFVEEHKKFLIVPHANVDPDGLSAALACHEFFQVLGKKCTVICPDTLPESLEFLPGYGKLEHEFDATRDFIITLDRTHGLEIENLRYTVQENSVNIIVTPKKGILTANDLHLQEGDFPYDAIVIVDTADIALLGSLYEEHRDFFAKVPILNIDHHVSNAGFGSIQLIRTTAASATEVLYDWFTHTPSWKAMLTPDLATLLLTGLITDTRSFQNPNTTPRSLEVAAELLDCGARQQEIIHAIYKTKPLSTLKIWGRALHNLQTNPAERIVWSAVSKEDLLEMQADPKETHGVIDELLTTIPDADLYVLFTEVGEKECKISMRSSEVVDANALAGRLFGGGGHARAAGFHLKNYANFQLAVLECVQKLIAGKKEGSMGTAPSTTSPQQVPPTKKDDGAGTVDILEKLTK